MKKFSIFIALVLASISVFAPLVYGVELEDYEVSEPYKTSIFYKTVSDYVLTGDQRYDVVAIALTQVGYNEGSSDADMHGNSSGDRNFVEFNRLYGKLDNDEGNGYSYGYMWCASFVNWVLRAANVDQRVTGGDVSCASWVNWFEGKNGFKTRTSGYVPMCGDIIFYKGSRTSSRSNHVGIVIGCEDGIVYTVEGNTTGIDGGADSTNGGEVARKSYHLSDTYIVGYGVPRYKVNEGTKYDFELVGITPSKLGTYTLVQRGKSVLRSPNSSMAVASVKKGQQIEITDIDGSFGKCTVNGTTGWVNLEGMIYGDAAYHTITYKGGDTVPAAAEKMFGAAFNISNEIPTKAGNKFLGWAIREGGNIIYQPKDAYKYNADLTLYAVWEPLSYTITFKDDTGNILSEKTYQYGATVEVPQIGKADSVNGDYILSWDQEITTVDGDKTYTAVFTLPEKEKEANPTPILIGVLIAVVIVGAGVIIFALKYTKKPEKTEEKTNVSA